MVWISWYVTNWERSCAFEQWQVEVWGSLLCLPIVIEKSNMRFGLLRCSASVVNSYIERLTRTTKLLQRIERLAKPPLGLHLTCLGVNLSMPICATNAICRKKRFQWLLLLTINRLASPPPSGINKVTDPSSDWPLFFGGQVKKWFSCLQS